MELLKKGYYLSASLFVITCFIFFAQQMLYGVNLFHPDVSLFFLPHLKNAFRPEQLQYLNCPALDTTWFMWLLNRLLSDTYAVVLLIENRSTSLPFLQFARFCLPFGWECLLHLPFQIRTSSSKFRYSV
jgi:hypothetical protein